MTSLADIVRSTAVLLLDFDGPVCRLFSGYPAEDIAEEIRAFLLDRGTDLPQELHNERDPLALLMWTGRDAPALLRQVEQIQESAEVEAAGSAASTAHSGEAIESARQSGRPVIIVSNNSARAIARYLTAHQLMASVSGVFGRVAGHPERMKPNPHNILRALDLIDSVPSGGVLVGDSVTDIQAAQKAGTPSIGYAKDTSRVARLTDAGADAVIGNMAVLADSFTKFPAEAT